MAIYEIKSDSIAKIEETSFSEAGVKERYDLQRLLRMQIDVISPDTLVIAEEFGEWEESKRRIDLLALNKEANLVVIELKRTGDGGHMELQAIRYAAMVSTMTFDKAVEVYDAYLKRIGSDLVPRDSVLEFLDWEEPDEDSFAQDVRLLLVSADFSKELTTSVMWLNERGLDIRCVRIKPYKDAERVLVDVQQIIPIPEATGYMIGIREKAGKERIDRADREGRWQLQYEFWETLLERSRMKTKLFADVSPWRDPGILVRIDGLGKNHYAYRILKHDAKVILVLDRDKERNKKDFDWLKGQQAAVEAAFGEPLEWNRRDNYNLCIIGKTLTLGGCNSDRKEWPAIQDAMIDAMVRLEKAFSPYVPKLASGV